MSLVCPPDEDRHTIPDLPGNILLPAAALPEPLLSTDASNFHKCFKIFSFLNIKVLKGRKTRRLLCPEHLAKLCHPLMSGSRDQRSHGGCYINDRNSCALACTLMLEVRRHVCRLPARARPPFSTG